MKQVKRYIAIALLICIGFGTNISIVHADETDKSCREEWAAKFDKADKAWLESVDKVVRQRDTSRNLIPYIINDYRTYMCELRAVCLEVANSIPGATAGKEIEKFVNIIGCFGKDNQRLLTPFQGCMSSESHAIQRRSSQCRFKMDEKEAIAKVFLKSVMNRDAAHRKTATIVHRYQLLNAKLHNLMWEHLRVMLGYFTEFIQRAKCYLDQCTLGPGLPVDLGDN